MNVVIKSKINLQLHHIFNKNSNLAIKSRLVGRKRWARVVVCGGEAGNYLVTLSTIELALGGGYFSSSTNYRQTRQYVYSTVLVDMGCVVCAW